jgi:hypothetical protein
MFLSFTRNIRGYVSRGSSRSICSIMFLGFPRNIRLWCPRGLMLLEICSSVMFFGHKHMLIGFWSRNICLFLVVSSWRCHLGAFVVTGQHRRLWSDSLGTTITLLVDLELPLVVVTYAPWASLLSREASSRSEGYLRTLQEVGVARSCMRWAWQRWHVSSSVESCCDFKCDRHRGWHPWCISWSCWRHGCLGVLFLLVILWAMCCCALVGNVVVIFSFFVIYFFFVWFGIVFHNMTQLLLILYIPEHHFDDFRTFEKNGKSKLSRSTIKHI